MLISPNTKLSHYTIISKLGGGGMGDVYLARDMRLGRDVAIKLLPEVVSRDSDRLKRFEQEARAASALNHPNILTIHEFGEVDAHHFIAMEFVEGETLRKRLAGSAMTLDATIDIAVQTANALAAAHAKGIVHRDIKPENIMLRRDGYVKVVDFGLAKLTANRSDPDAATLLQTKPGLLMGTVLYMSPEQARGQSLDARTDIWSLGVVLYEALSGKPPHYGASVSETLASILEHEPPPLPTAVPQEMSRIVAKCLAKKRNERYQSAEDLLDELKTLRRMIDSSALTPTLITSPPSKSVSRRWAIGAALALIVACATLVYLFLAHRSRISASPQPSISSLVVLPLNNLSGDAENDYFVDGMTETLTADLAKIGRLRVISRTTAMRYKNTTKSIQDIAQELHVDGIVTGSLLRAGESVRIEVQLVQAVPEERYIWSQTYDRDIRDVVALQNDVARSIAREIKITLSPNVESLFTNNRQVDPDAYRAYLKGMFHLNQATLEGTQKGLERLKEAVEKDPTNPLPHAYLAMGYAALGHGPSPPPDAFDRARKEALEALALDNTVAEAHEVLAQLTMYDDKSYDWPAAEQSFKRALDLNPTLAASHAHYAWYLVLFDHWEEGFASMRRAQEVDPLTPLWPAWQGSLYWWTGRNNEAIQECQKALELNANFPVALSVLGRAYSDVGNHKDAIDAQEKAAAANSTYLWSLAYAYARAGRRTDALKTADEFKRLQGDRYELGVIYAALGDKEEAIQALETAYERGECSPWIRNLHVFAAVRNDPRFQALLRKMNLPG